MDPAYELFLNRIRQFLEEAQAGNLPKEDEEYLRILADTKRNLEYLQETGDWDNNATLKNLCEAVLYGEYISLRNNAAVFSQKFNEVEEAEAKGLPEILQPKLKEIKGYFAKLRELIQNMDSLANKISNKAEDWRLNGTTKKDEIELEFLSIDFETVKKQITDVYQQANSVLRMFEEDLDSYMKDAKNKCILYAGLTLFGAVATGGAALVASGGYTSRNSTSATFRTPGNALPYIVGATVAFTGLALSLAMLWKGWVSKRNFCDKLILILRDYRELINESQRISLQSS